MTPGQNLPLKTVYVLGAGFSVDAGFPLQSQILERIRSFKVDLMRAPRHAMEVFLPAQKKLFEFIGEVFPQQQLPRLEDLFTLLDQTVGQKQYCAGFNLPDLKDRLDSLKRAILFIFHVAGERVAN